MDLRARDQSHTVQQLLAMCDLEYLEMWLVLRCTVLSIYQMSVRWCQEKMEAVSLILFFFFLSLACWNDNLLAYIGLSKLYHEN